MKEETYSIVPPACLLVQHVTRNYSLSRPTTARTADGRYSLPLLLSLGSESLHHARNLTTRVTPCPPARARLSTRSATGAATPPHGGLC